MSRIRLPDCSRLGLKWKNDNDITNCRHDIIVKFSWRFFVSLVKFSYRSKFHLCIITGSGVMAILFIKDWPEIRKLEIPLSEFCPISGDWGKLEIPNLARMSLIQCYWMLQNAKVTAFTVSELLSEKQRGIKLPPPQCAWPRVGLKNWQVCQL